MPDIPATDPADLALDPGYVLEIANWDTDAADLKAVRTEVFLVEQAVPEDEEWDALDARSVHVLARDAQGRPIATGRLTPERKIGRMAVVAAWRGKGVGEAILRTLIEQARARRWPEVALNAQTHAIPFYRKAGFEAYGDEFMEANIPHRTMRLGLSPSAPAVRAGDRLIDGSRPAVLEAGTALEAEAAVDAVLAGARHKLWIYSRELDPALLDREAFLEALKTLALSGRGAEIRILVHDARAAVADGHRLLHLAARLPTFIQIRTPVIEEDRQYPSAFVANDTGGYFFRALASRYDGEGNLRAPGRTRQLTDAFNRVWEHAEPDPELRRLSL